MRVEEILAQWKSEESQWDELGLYVSGYIKKTIGEVGFMPEITHRTKDILSIIKKIKKKSIVHDSYSIESLTDRLGIRIVCSFKEDLDLIDQYLVNHFKILKRDFKYDSLTYNQLDYTSNHYDISIDSLQLSFNQAITHLTNMTFEVQVRTINQHVWSNTTHALAYKQEAPIPDLLKRRVYRLLSLYEIADDEFSVINQLIASDEHAIVHQILKVIEPEFYKAARIEYHRDLSLHNIEKILSLLSNEVRSSLKKSLILFVEYNRVKINQIFDSIRDEYAYYDVITQPEILLFWYLHSNHKFLIKNHWHDFFDENDIEKICNLWGTNLS